MTLHEFAVRNYGYIVGAWIAAIWFIVRKLKGRA